MMTDPPLPTALPRAETPLRPVPPGLKVRPGAMEACGSRHCRRCYEEAAPSAQDP